MYSVSVGDTPKIAPAGVHARGLSPVKERVAPHLARGISPHLARGISPVRAFAARALSPVRNGGSGNFSMERSDGALSMSPVHDRAGSGNFSMERSGSSLDIPMATQRRMQGLTYWNTDESVRVGAQESPRDHTTMTALKHAVQVALMKNSQPRWSTSHSGLIGYAGC